MAVVVVELAPVVLVLVVRVLLSSGRATMVTPLLVVALVALRQACTLVAWEQRLSPLGATPLAPVSLSVELVTTLAAVALTTVAPAGASVATAAAIAAAGGAGVSQC